LKPVWLEEIYRQRNAPELKEIVKDLHAEDHQAAFAKMRDLGVYREFDERGDLTSGLIPLQPRYKSLKSLKIKTL
jgi:hypothetical protein